MTAIQPADTSPLGSLAALALQAPLPKRLRWALTAYTVGHVAWKQGSKAWASWKDRSRYWVSVPGDDEVYGELHEWLLARMPEKDRRSVIARSTARMRYAEVMPSSESRPRPAERVRLLYDSNAAQTVLIGGHAITVSVSRPDWVSKLGGNSTPEWLAQRAREEERMVFSCPDATAHQAVLEWLGEVVAAHEEVRSPKLRIAARWGGWNQRNDLPLRSLDTVVLRDDHRQVLVDDLEQFLAAEDAYSQMGVPWHRGYLFEGPPGTGKTSLARALATHFGLDVWYIPLSDLDADTKLLNLVAEVTAGSMLLLEDIDSLAAAHTRTDEAPSVTADTPYGISAAGLFNSLDGVATPHGLITVMTTNHVERLDKALLRGGRVDLALHVGELSADQLRAMVTTFLGAEHAECFADVDDEAVAAVTPAAVVATLKNHVGDTAGALLDLKELVHGPA